MTIGKFVAERGWRVGPIALGAITLAFVWSAGRHANPGALGFRLDDAWIHLVYARGLVEDHAFTYNPGVPATGCTSPLWALVLAVLHTVLVRGGDDLTALFAGVFVAGAALQLATIGAAATLARDATGSRAAGALAGVLVAFASPWVAAAYSGMEVTLAGFLLVAGAGAAVRGAWGRAGWMMAAAALARPEAAAATLVITAAIAMAGRPAANAKQSGAPRPRELARFLAPSIAAGGALALLNAATSGSPLPATFHEKSAFEVAALAPRLLRALSTIFVQIPPWGLGLGWLALLGYFVRGASGAEAGSSGANGNGGAAGSPVRDSRALIPLLAGGAFLFANVALVDPVDAGAFYHVRYILPAVPALLAALAIGAWRAGSGLPGRAAAAPAFLLFFVAAAEFVRTAPAESRRLHNDVRNINEVQRSLGGWLAEHIPEGEWIAAGDAGAIRYMSRRPTIDVLGLNTPAPREDGAAAETFLSEHPVRALVVMPAWFTPENAEGLRVAREAETTNYTVTSNPRMALQVVVEAEGAAADSVASGAALGESGRARRVRWRGYRSFAIDLLPAAPTPSRAAP